MRQELPFIANLRTRKEVVKALEPFANRNNPHSYEALAYVLAGGGDVAPALGAIAALLKLVDTDVPWQQELASRAESIRDQLLADSQKAQRQLTSWETETINNLGLDGFRENQGR
jgi:hypothetical protein